MKQRSAQAEALVRRITNLRRTGLSWADVAEWMNKAGTVTLRGFAWNRESVRSLARGEACAEQKSTLTVARRLGITGGDVVSIRSRSEACEVCGLRPERNGKKRSLYVDHSHASGAVRGLLCVKCNTGLGYFRDDPALLRRAAGYLDAANEKARVA